MLKNTWPQYIAIRLVVLCFSWIGPLCVGYTAWNALESCPEWPATSILSAWCAVEALFFFFFLFFRKHLQRAAVHPRPRTEEERRALFAKVRAEVFNPESFFSGWFRGAKVEDIGREDVKIFLSWAFWDGAADLSPGGADEEELNEYIAKVEIMMAQPFKPGRGTARSLRLTLDPIDMECRTLFWYGVSIMLLALDLIKRSLTRICCSSSCSLTPLRISS